MRIVSTENSNQESVVSSLKSLSNSTFLKWFALLNGGLILTLLWTGPLAVWIPVFGFGGALLSLVFAKWLAKRAHQITLIDPSSPATEEQKALHAVVADLAQRAGLPKVPEVGVYESEDMNAFATGATPGSALVAFSSALLERMDQEQIKAVAAHEIAHIANKDMLGMVLLQGVINSIVLVATLPLAGLRWLNGHTDGRSAVIDTALWVTKAAIAMFLTFLGSLVVKAFSRNREYKADAAAAVLLGKDPMISALKTLATDTAEIPVAQRAYAAFKVSGRAQFGEFFSTHPLIEKRVAALEAGQFAPKPMQ